MVFDGEPRRVREPPQRLIQAGFELLGEVEVGNTAADATHQVMVVAEEVLGQLDVCVLVGGDDPMRNPCGNELGHVPVGGADRKAGVGGHNRRELHG